MTSRGPPPTHRSRIESQIIRRREREEKQEELWTGCKNYYEKYEQQNAQYDEWTSPRYQENQTKLLEKRKKDKEHEQSIERRRDQLRKLFYEEDQSNQVELMVRKTKNSNRGRCRSADVSTEVLKSLNLTLKVEEEDRRRHEAELKLYHQWRSTNPILQHYERMQKSRDMKLTWLDQQIELRMKKQAEEEENRKIEKERRRLMEEERLKEEQFKKDNEHKRELLRIGLDKQIEELKEKAKISEELQAKEKEEMKRRMEIANVEEQRVAEEKQRIEREYALYNIKQYKFRLKKKAEMVQQRLEEERNLVKKLRQLDVVERIENETRRKEIRQALKEFLKISEEQKELEKCRQKYMDFIFDSEAKLRYEQQDEQWRNEERARANLLKDVLDTIKEQIEENVQKNRQKQMEIINEREEMIKHIEEYQNELKQLREDEERRKKDAKKRIDEQVKSKKLKKKQEENFELKKIDEELERAKKEEERLKKEILNIQRRQGPIRPQRSKIFL